MDTVWFSDKRRKLLLLLLEGAKGPEEIKDAFGVSWHSLILPIKELREDELIANNDSVYELSSIGRMIAENVKPIDGILTLLEGNTDYWADRDLGEIPPHLLDSIGDIEDYTIVEPDLNNMFELPERFLQSLNSASRIHAVFSIYHPLYPGLYCQLAKKGTPIEIILTGSVLMRMREECREEMENVLQLPNMHLFVCDNNTVPPSLINTDNMFLVSLFTRGGRYDHRDVLSFEKGSIEWGRSLFDHYKKNSRELSRLSP